MNEPSSQRITEFAIHAQQLVGGLVTKAAVGVGSMITVQVEHTGEDHRIDAAWIRLAEWALLKDEAEIVSSDLPDADFERLKHRVGDLVASMVLDTHLFDDGELHLDFSGHHRLEIWPKNETYGEGVDLVSLFASDEHIATLTG